jgi:hypothetical protein
MIAVAWGYIDAEKALPVDALRRGGLPRPGSPRDPRYYRASLPSIAHCREEVPDLRGTRGTRARPLAALAALRPTQASSYVQSDPDHGAIGRHSLSKRTRIGVSWIVRS